jgi:hypothetical protein
MAFSRNEPGSKMATSDLQGQYSRFPQQPVQRRRFLPFSTSPLGAPLCIRQRLLLPLAQGLQCSPERVLAPQRRFGWRRVSIT